MSTNSRESNFNPPKIIERVHAFDVVRGFAVIFMIVMHTGLHEWLGAQELEGGSQDPDPLIGVLIFFLTLAGVYSAILGAVNSYMYYRRIESGRNQPKQLILYGCLLGSILILLNFIFRIFFSGDSGMVYFWIKTGESIPFDPYWLISSSAPTILGLNSIILPLILNAILKRTNVEKNFKRVYIILFVLGVLILVLSLPIRLYLTPFVDTLISQDHYLLAWFLGIFVFDNFPIFPLTSYACFGAILGIALARKEKSQFILRYTWFQAVFWFIVGIIGIMVGGGIHPALIYENSPAGLLEDFFRLTTQLGMVFIFFGMALMIVDYSPSQKKEKRIKGFKFISRCGMISLTVYIFEALFSGLVARIFNSIPSFDNWNASMVNVVLLGFGLVFFWGGLAKWWEKKAFKYSVEWWMIQLAGKLSGKKSEKYNLDRLD